MELLVRDPELEAAGLELPLLTSELLAPGAEIEACGCGGVAVAESVFAPGPRGGLPVASEFPCAPFGALVDGWS